VEQPINRDKASNEHKGQWERMKAYVEAAPKRFRPRPAGQIHLCERCCQDAQINERYLQDGDLIALGEKVPKVLYPDKLEAGRGEELYERVT